MYNINYFKNYGSEEYPYWQSVDRDTATHFNHELLVYGDYCNTGAVGRANVQTILDDSDLCERVGVIELNEAYNTTSLMFPIKALQDEGLQEILKALEGYPCLDDDLMSDIEQEMQSEAWASYGQCDFERYLASLGYDTDDISSDTLDELFDYFRSISNYDIGHVDGDSWYFDFESMGGVKKEVITEYLNTKLDKVEA